MSRTWEQINKDLYIRSGKLPGCVEVCVDTVGDEYSEGEVAKLRPNQALALHRHLSRLVLPAVEREVERSYCEFSRGGKVLVAYLDCGAIVIPDHTGEEPALSLERDEAMGLAHALLQAVAAADEAEGGVEQ